jgi:alkanesulfonate monooxygenase SsuD/methylene tetrahydromethanopterin reductase-like flavin-dependent oxidoreductase (luciferase family)
MGTKTLMVAAKHANAVNFAWSQPTDIIEDRLNVLNKHCNKIGRDFNEIKKSVGLMVRIVDESENMKVDQDERYLRYLGRQNPVMHVSSEGLAETLSDYIGVGVSHFILRFHYCEELMMLRKFAKEVIPKI